jgi:pimeloyl-ACP methyl ester carboxylesterase
MPLIPAPGVDLHVERRGEKPQLVFVHGFAGDLHTWDPLWQHLDASRPALRYDLRGFGQSVCREHVPYKHADDLLTILDAEKIERCDLVGASMGGSIALNFALDHPERVRHLVLISPGLAGWERSDEWQAQMHAIEALARNGDLQAAKRLWWEHPMFATTRNSPAADILKAEVERYSGEQWRFDHHLPMLPDIERLHTLQAPTLLLTGAHDVAESRLIAEVIANSAPNVRRVDFPHSGHMLHIEEPQACAREIEWTLSET